MRNSNHKRAGLRVWRVKDGNRDVFSGTKSTCAAWIREHQAEYTTRLRLVAPHR